MPLVSRKPRKHSLPTHNVLKVMSCPSRSSNPPHQSPLGNESLSVASGRNVNPARLYREEITFDSGSLEGMYCVLEGWKEWE